MSEYLGLVQLRTVRKKKKIKALLISSLLFTEQL